MRERPVITVDGPSGAGKSTVAKALAKALGYEYMDTGAMYRAVAYAYSREKEKPPLDIFLKKLVLKFVFGNPTRVFLNSQEISSEIRTHEISMQASALSQDARVRRYLTAMQRELGKDGGIVLEGRDTGSVVFPDAEVKFYLDADVGVRARRRYLESGKAESTAATNGDLSTIKKDMEKRDRDDSEREIAPLIRPEGAHYVDTTHLGVGGVVRLLREHVERALRCSRADSGHESNPVPDHT